MILLGATFHRLVHVSDFDNTPVLITPGCHSLIQFIMNQAFCIRNRAARSETGGSCREFLRQAHFKMQ